MSSIKSKTTSTKAGNVGGKREREPDPSRQRPPKKQKQQQQQQQQQHNQQQQQQQRRRGPAGTAVSLESFAQRKGHVRALQEFKKRKQIHRVETAKTLRKYRKVMKQEGMEAGVGASRKRNRRPEEEGHDGNQGGIASSFNKADKDSEILDEYESASQGTMNPMIAEEEKGNLAVDDRGRTLVSGNGNGSNINEGKSQLVTSDRRNKHPKSNPLQKSMEKAKTSKAKAEEARLEREAQEKLRAKKLRERKRQSKLLQKRTEKGQPIMKHAVDNLLLKLMKQQQG